MDLANKAQGILGKNWQDGFTIPTAKLYPFQWLWDSGFVSMGTGTFDLDRSILEIRKMFTGQWKNGLVPHIVFHSETETSYFPNWDFWNCEVNTGAPNKPKTSGITQPPVFGFVLEKLWAQHYGNNNLRLLIKEILPKVVDFHRFLYNYRDRNKEGLFYIFHPWESGRDNSPIWDEAMNSIKIAPGDIPSYVRKDTLISDASERPTADKYDRYVYLMKLGEKHKYDGPGIAEESPFLIQDCMMNAILIRSNQALINLAGQFGFDTAEIQEWQDLSLANFDKKFWNSKLQTYVCYDLKSEKQILHKEIGGLISLFACIPSWDKARQMRDYIQSIHDKGYYLCPSFDPEDALFDSKRYWRGPIWPQMNWMIHEGLNNYGFHKLAEITKNDLKELISRLGFYEYFESDKGKVLGLEKGYGGNDFSWTASSYLMFQNTI